MANPQVLVATYDAVGGPEKSYMASDGYAAGPTDAGAYRLAGCWRHSSRAYPVWSKVRWGSKLREKSGTLEVEHDGKWRSLEKLTGLTKAEIEERHRQLYSVSAVPKTWVFNDFGHLTCYFYKDVNRNRKLDKNERIHAEFFHTTPDDEAATALGKAVRLSESHGCIHLKPTDIDTMVAKGYMKRGNVVRIHSYKDAPAALRRVPDGSGPFELHFYPGKRKLLILGHKKN